MGTDTIIAPELRWSKEVQEYASQEGVEQYLPILWEMIRRLIPSAQRIEVFVEDDPEIANLRFIVFEVQVPGWDAQRLYETHCRWIEGLLQSCPSPRSTPFVLALQPSDPCKPKNSST